MPEPTAEIATDEDELAPPRSKEPPPSAPAYTGGIFNLGAPAESSSRNLDYLLEDDDEPKTGKIWLLIAVALALVVGLGWLRWRHEGLPAIGSLIASKTKTPAPQNPEAPANSAEAATPGSAPSPPTPAPSAPQTSDSQTAPVAAQPTGGAAPSAPGSPAVPAGSSESAAADHPPSSPAPANASEDTTAASAAAPAPVPSKSDAKTDSAPAAPAESKPAARKPSPTPPPKPAPKADSVTLGEQYLYGRGGVSQNCERGLRYVKPAADQSNTKAMITMGALYATGHCISRDLPTAYRYFALALRTDPENGPLRQNVDMVWKQMTAEERKQAIRLTQ